MPYGFIIVSVSVTEILKTYWLNVELLLHMNQFDYGAINSVPNMQPDCVKDIKDMEIHFSSMKC